MFVRDVMLVPATQIRSDATVGEALDLFRQWHLEDILIVGPKGEFMGEIRATQFAKMLLRGGIGVIAVGGHEEEAKRETYADLQKRLQIHLGRRVTDFMDEDVPTVTSDTPVMDALILLRGGAIRIAVIEGLEKKLVGSLSVLTVLRRIEEYASQHQ